MRIFAPGPRSQRSCWKSSAGRSFRRTPGSRFHVQTWQRRPLRHGRRRCENTAAACRCRNLHEENRSPVPHAAPVMMARMSDADGMDALVDDGGDVQRQHLRAAGVLIAKDSPLIPTTTVVAGRLRRKPGCYRIAPDRCRAWRRQRGAAHHRMAAQNCGLGRSSRWRLITQMGPTMHRPARAVSTTDRH